MTTTVGLVAAGRVASGISGTLSMSGGTCTHTHHIVSLFACMATALCYYYRRVYIRARD